MQLVSGHRASEELVVLLNQGGFLVPEVASPEKRDAQGPEVWDVVHPGDVDGGTVQHSRMVFGGGVALAFVPGVDRGNLYFEQEEAEQADDERRVGREEPVFEAELDGAAVDQEAYLAGEVYSGKVLEGGAGAKQQQTHEFDHRYETAVVFSEFASAGEQEHPAHKGPHRPDVDAVYEYEHEQHRKVHIPS